MHSRIGDAVLRSIQGVLPHKAVKSIAAHLPGGQSGNIFFGVFAALAMVGVLGASTMMIMKGPVRTMHRVTQRTIAENNMIASAKLAVMGAGAQGDCDGDSSIEPVAFLTTGTGPKPPGGGYLPADLGAALEDPWGNAYGYCSWDHGSAIKKTSPAPTCPTPSSRLKGSADSKGPVVAIVSSGPDRVFQTSCGDAPTFVHKVSGSDDIIMQYTYAEANAMAGGLWTLKSGDADTAEIAKDLEVKDANDNVVFGVDSTSDINRPSIKVDYIKALGQPQVEMISPLRVSGGRIQATNGGLSTSSSSDEGGYVEILNPLKTGATTKNWTLFNMTGTYGNGLAFWRYYANGTNAGPSLWLDDSGKVGIGTKGPTSKLTVATTTDKEALSVLSTGADLSIYEDGDFPGWITLRSNAGNGIQIMGQPDTGALYVSRTNSRVGIGTTAPQSLFHVDGDSTFDGRIANAGDWSTGYDLWVQGSPYGSASGDDRNLALLGVKSTDKLYVNYNGEYAGGTVLGGTVSASKVTGLAAPSAASDAANKSYVDAHIAAGTGFSETDPQVSTVTSGKWCRGNGAAVVCDQSAPSGGLNYKLVTGVGSSPGEDGSSSCGATATAICPSGYILVACPGCTQVIGNRGYRTISSWGRPCSATITIFCIKP